MIAQFDYDNLSWNGECAVKMGDPFERMVKCYGYDARNRKTGLKMVSCYTE